ncbi:hypothetical protein BWR17_19125 (plasmid) [Phaeobacter inhibens]|uniref:VOC family protein n=1 Tax=Phaeobacter inhibens TaxID=221822 RepID=UPI000971B4AB|nr:VOC family protein [Phaeobacter inhibens]APX18004.1 hypothetical protein BWR17_19125 [Phaeobacter inhibens]
MEKSITSICLASADPESKAAFYRDILGMAQTGPATFRFGSAEAELSFVQGSGDYAPQPSDLYWKIAIAVPDLDLACLQLITRGVAVDGPRQFRDLGYLAHIVDPEGFQIELIQHVFDGEPKPSLQDPEALGGGPSLNLVTLRTNDIASVRALCEERLNMRLLCIEPVELYGFTLYFYAFTDDVPPDLDPTATANRCWTYQRPYTVLEVQHHHEHRAIAQRPEGAPGYCGLKITGLSAPYELLQLMP